MGRNDMGGRRPRTNKRAMAGGHHRKSRQDEAFDRLTTLHPYKRLKLEHGDDLTCRVIDLIAPIGKGQRALIVSPPRAGKTTTLQSIAKGILTNDPDAKLFILLVNERPEEVTEIRRSGYGEVIFSSFDKADSHHIEVAEKLLVDAKKLVLEGQDVIILLDSITRLARSYNSVMPSSGRLLSGGMDSNGMFMPKKYFGAGRAIEDGGSLTIIGTVLTDTGSRMDEVIFEEFKGTGNMEVHLDRKLMEKRVFPCIDITRSGTRKEEILLSEDELAASKILRNRFFSMDALSAMETLLGWMEKTATNAEFLDSLTK